MTLVVVDGLIGAGKTTYIQKLEEGLKELGMNVVVVREPVKQWEETGLLNLFYSDPKRWSYHFQTRVFCDRINAIREAYEEHSNSAEIFIMERSPYSDGIFAKTLHENGSMTDLEYNNYLAWSQLWRLLMPTQPNLFIYLRPDVETCMERMTRRNRGNETSGVSFEYQKRLGELHDQMFNSESVGGKCHIIEGGINLESSTIVQEFLSLLDHNE